MEFWGLACGDWNSRWWLLIALHYHRFVYVSHNEQHCSYPSEVMSSSLPCAPPLSLPLPISFLPLSLYLFISFFLPHCPLPPSTIHSFLSSLPLSSHLTLSLSSMWVATTLLSSRTPWNVLSECWNLRNFSGGGPPSGWTGCHYRPTSVLAVPFDAPSLHPGATLHFAQSRKECVRIFCVDRLRLLVEVNNISSLYHG